MGWARNAMAWAFYPVLVLSTWLNPSDRELADLRAAYRQVLDTPRESPEREAAKARYFALRERQPSL